MERVSIAPLFRELPPSVVFKVSAKFGKSFSLSPTLGSRADSILYRSCMEDYVFSSESQSCVPM